MSSPRIVIDTNVLVSGLRFRQGMSYRLLSFLGGRLYRPVVTVPLVVEYEKSLCDPRTKVPFCADEVGRYLDFVCSVSDCCKVHFLWRPFLPDSLHETVRVLAREEHVSINQLISTAVAEKISALMTETYLAKRAALGARKDFDDMMSRVPDVSADPHDVR